MIRKILYRLFPHPQLTFFLLLIWLLLVNNLTVGNVVLGLILGVLIPGITQPFWPNRPKVARPLKAAQYILLVLWDICVANVAVARIILFKTNANTHSQWIVVPLDLRSPEAITVLAGTITMTPGTVTAMLSADAQHLLVHCLDSEDPDAVRDEIKHRYERRLKEIFE
ncbi:Na+/H+ antiporter subunit E [Aliiruegeria lutimaris]|uniref:Multisubunit potassium/proton antiporter, PhaE subunit n=1 Tax=Aliiruegeria lutimaris TaxID=571298 RepID=A0A1G8IUF1_9RHOB|nr:Na+/H+ antiporter subunit E [Aliiruegeria lutimaris]SDI22473.1 multisubunit potassium/proton antiporter, PhaE subunit [Aliiruegeria lutimaris]